MSLLHRAADAQPAPEFRGEPGKRCARCRRRRRLAEFWTMRTKDGIVPRPECKHCHRIVARRSYHRRKAAQRPARVLAQAAYRADPRYRTARLARHYTRRDERKAALRAQLEAAGLARCAEPVLRLPAPRPCRAPVAFVIHGMPYCVAHARRHQEGAAAA